MSNINFWQKLRKPFTVLAPMANVTDWAFRQVILEAGRPTFAKASAGKPDVFFTEFVSADGIVVMGQDKFKGELYFTENERPIVAQFFGANPENMYKCAQLAQELGFDGIDINMGCPDRSIEKQGAGAALMRNPELAKKIIEETIRGAGILPVSVKTRLGFSRIESDWIENLLSTKIAALSVHLRTRKEMSKVPAHWEEAGKISEKAKKTNKLIIGNGDVANMEDVCRKAEQYGLDGIMIGRGIFQNPWFFNHGSAEGNGKNGNINLDTRNMERASSERIKLLKIHLENFEKLWGGRQNGYKSFNVMKRFVKVYINGWPGAKELRTKLMTAKNRSEAVDFISETRMLY